MLEPTPPFSLFCMIGIPTAVKYAMFSASNGREIRQLEMRTIFLNARYIRPWRFHKRLNLLQLATLKSAAQPRA